MAYRVVADHIRTLSVCIAPTVSPLGCQAPRGLEGLVNGKGGCGCRGEEGGMER